MAGATTGNYEVSQNDLRELKRVFDFLADFAPKHKLRKELQPKAERKQKIVTYLKNPDSVKVIDETGAELPRPVIESDLARIELEMEAIQKKINEIDSKPELEKLIHHRDLQQALAFLGKVTDKVCLLANTTFYANSYTAICSFAAERN